MKLSRKFVSDYVDIDVDIKTLAEDMTSIGNEYDACGKLLPVSNVVIGEIIDCIDHPDSDHLHVCQVDIKTAVLQIVCGAPNARKGIKVIVALDGAVLPGGTIKKGSIRGKESNGMLCAFEELGLDHKFLKEEDIKGIHELPNDAPIGEDPISYMGMDDEVIDFDLTSNRGDLLSILGMAYEIGALYNKDIKDIDLSFKEIEEDVNDSFTIDIKTENCPLFLAKKVKNVTIKESPEFIRNRLIASGIRPINNVVDISNYVMLETGQPLHYYDANRLGNKLVVRMAEDGEQLTTLDTQERILTTSDIVIATDDKIVGLAGVMGGLDTEIEEDTVDIIIESAIFDAIAIRKTSKKVLRSEASSRYEKGLDPKRTYMAMLRSCHLLEKYADATITSGIVEYKNINSEEKKIDITPEKINKILGVEIPTTEILDIFRKLNFTAELNNNIITVTVPSRRVDISIREDLIEEVGRIYGLDNIIGKKLILPIKPGNLNKTKRIIRNKLASLGLSETLSYALISENDVYKFKDMDFDKVKVSDPMSEDRNTLRYSLLSSLLNIYNYNKARHEKDICIYEIGKSFYRKDDEYQEEERLAILMTGNYSLGLKKSKVDFYTIKGVLEELLDYLGYENRYRLEIESNMKEMHPGQTAAIILNNKRVGVIGKVHPSITKDDIYVIEINLESIYNARVKAMEYKELSKYPSISKDIAFVVKKDVSADDIKSVIKRSSGKLLTNISIFDVYEGENVKPDEKSIAFNLTFNDQTKTLSDEEVMTIFNNIINDVKSKLSADIRNK